MVLCNCGDKVWQNGINGGDDMEAMRWTGSDRAILEAQEIDTLAGEVAEEILDEQYDGYKARNPVLASMIAFHLCGMTVSERWLVYTDELLEEDGRVYRVWVERWERGFGE